MNREQIEQERQFVFEMLDDFASHLDTVMIYKIPAVIGGRAVNSTVRMLPLESQPFNLLLSQERLQHWEKYFLEELVVDWSGNWEDSLLLDVFNKNE